MCPLLPCVHVKDRIDLTAKEEQIFNRLLQLLRHFNLQTQLRVAGGWVRDKSAWGAIFAYVTDIHEDAFSYDLYTQLVKRLLLGKESYDIDIALDDMFGWEFAEKVNEYLLSAGEGTHRPHSAPRNPDKSKHLETATLLLFDVKIDFVNLRAEDYSENSRIPTMRFGTPEDDAYRRDLTINSLFYNIRTSSVEDFTGRGNAGIIDLKSGKIVTPLPPKRTFLDDPLRVLRAIRFGARFGFSLDEELKKAAADNDVVAAISDKISRERIGLEIDLMISGNEPMKAMVYISELQLFWAVFSLPRGVEPPTREGCERLCVAYMDSAWRLLQLIGSWLITNDQQRLCLYASLLLPLRNVVYKDKKKKIPVTTYIFRNSLKLKASDAETVVSMHEAAESFLSLIPSIISDENLQTLEVGQKKETIDVPLASKRRILTGLLLRETKEFWRPSLVLSLLLYPGDIISSNENAELKERKAVYNRMENSILEMGLENVWELKPLVDGKRIMDILKIKWGGPIVKEWQHKLLQWQLAYPEGSTQECVDWITINT